MRKTMTNEQKLLAYLFTVPYIKRKQLSVALPDMPYQCLTRAVRTALVHGYVECTTVAKCRAIRLTKEGTRYIRSEAGDGLDKAQRRAATVNADTEGKRRFERRETAVLVHIGKQRIHHKAPHFQPDTQCGITRFLSAGTVPCTSFAGQNFRQSDRQNGVFRSCDSADVRWDLQWFFRENVAQRWPCAPRKFLPNLRFRSQKRVGEIAFKSVS